MWYQTAIEHLPGLQSVFRLVNLLIVHRLQDASQYDPRGFVVLDDQDTHGCWIRHKWDGLASRVQGARQNKLAALDHAFAKGVQLGPGEPRRSIVPLFPSVDSRVADPKLPRQVLLAQDELLPY